MRRSHYALVFLAFVLVALYYLSPVASTSARSALSIFSADGTCPDPFVVRPTTSVHNPQCRPLATHAGLDAAHALDVELCLSSTIANHGWVRIARTDQQACAASEALPVSNHPESDVLIRSKGPDVFHFRFDGEQRWATETEVEYLGSCSYRYPFRLATAAPVNMTIWWVWEDYRAVLETEELATQYDKARPVLADTHTVLRPLAPARCPTVGAAPTQPQWRASKLAALVDTLPVCSAYKPTEGVYLRPHHSEEPKQFFQQYLFQPSSCRWSDPLRFGAPSEVTTRDFQERRVLFLGDSHARFAFDLLMNAYQGDWTAWLNALALKGLEKSETFGQAQFDFVWEPVLTETRIQINCTVAAKYDTIVLSAGQHNAVHIPNDKDHPKQYSIRDWQSLIGGLAQRLSPDACPGQRTPKVIWMGNPARIVRVEPSARSEWIDGRSSLRVRLYDQLAWDQLSALPGVARVDMFGLSQPFVNDFKDMLHMRHTDALAALVQDLHEKIRPTERAYMHIANTMHRARRLQPREIE